MFLLFINGNNNDKWFPDSVERVHQTRQLQPTSPSAHTIFGFKIFPTFIP